MVQDGCDDPKLACGERGARFRAGLCRKGSRVSAPHTGWRLEHEHDRAISCSRRCGCGSSASGSTVSAYSSSNGSSWSSSAAGRSRSDRRHTSASRPPATIASAATTAVVSQVSVIPTSLPAPQKDVDIGAPAIKGSASYRQGVYTHPCRRRGHLGHVRPVQFRVSADDRRRRSGCPCPIYRGPSNWSKTGVMIRETLAARFAARVCDYFGGVRLRVSTPARPGWFQREHGRASGRRARMGAARAHGSTVSGVLLRRRQYGPRSAPMRSRWPIRSMLASRRRATTPPGDRRGAR